MKGFALAPATTLDGDRRCAATLGAGSGGAINFLRRMVPSLCR